MIDASGKKGSFYFCIECTSIWYNNDLSLNQDDDSSPPVQAKVTQISATDRQPETSSTFQIVWKEKWLIVSPPHGSQNYSASLAYQNMTPTVAYQKETHSIKYRRHVFFPNSRKNITGADHCPRQAPSSVYSHLFQTQNSSVKSSHSALLLKSSLNELEYELDGL